MGTLPERLSDLITTAQRLYQIDKQERRLEKKAENKNNNRSKGQGPNQSQINSDSKPTQKQKSRSNHNNRDKSQKKQKLSPKTKDKSTVTCYRYNHLGHYSNKYRATKTTDRNPIPAPKLNATQLKQEKNTTKQPERDHNQ
jgi:hypothetical protein